jgi:serine/threonine protein kinase/Flp pilus assembly protein TadD
MIGKTISHYRIVSKVGEGGMGVVYEAEDTTLRRKVALKFLPPQSLGSGKDHVRFLREAQTAAALDHPNICTVHEIDEADGKTFIAMAFLEGLTLQERIATGPLPLDEVLDIAGQIAAGLAAAHAKQIVHRDIKSANVMLLTDGQVKIMDFGLAKLPDQTVLTQQGAIVGTTAYMSPEQARGGEVDQRSDLWSLGVIVNEMITGQLPFKGDSDQSLLYSVVHEEPDPPTSMRTGVSLELDHLVLKALTKDPDERYQRAEEMQADLRRLKRQSDSGSLRPVSAVARPRRRRWLKVASWSTLILAAMVVVGFLVLTPGSSIPFAERDWILITDFENDTGEEIFQGTIREALSIDLQQSQYVNVFSGKRLTDALYRTGRQNVDVIDGELGREIAIREGITAVLEGSISKIGHSYLLSARLINPTTGDAVNTKRVEARKQEKVLEALDNLSRDIRKNLGESLISIGRRDAPLAQVSTSSLTALQYFTLGGQATRTARWDEAIPLFMEAIAADSSFATAYYSIAVLLHNLGRTADALQYSAMARERNHMVTEREKYHIEAEYFRIREEYQKAIEQYKLLIRLYPDDFNAHNNLGFTLQFLRHYAEAVEESREVARLYPESWYAHHNAALAHAGTGNLEQAETEFQAALQVNPNAYWSSVGLSWIRAIAGDYDGTFQELDRPTPSGYEWESLKHVHYGALYRYFGEDDKARNHIRKAITADERIDNRQAAAWKGTVLADILRSTGDDDAALAALQRAEELYPDAQVLACLGREYARRGAFQPAAEAVDSLEAILKRESRNSNRAFLYLLRGEIDFYQEDYQGAVQNLERSLVNLDLVHAHVALGRTYFALERYSQAKEQFRYLIDHQWACFFDGYPDVWPLAHYYLGSVYDREGEPDEAVRHYERLLELWGDSSASRAEVRQIRVRLAELKG